MICIIFGFFFTFGRDLGGGFDIKYAIIVILSMFFIVSGLTYLFQSIVTFKNK